MNSNHIQSEISNRVLTISMNRPEKKNALTSEMYLTMAELLTKADAEKGVKCAVIQGQIDLFTSGNDVKDFLNSDRTKVPPAIHFLKAISKFSKPLIGAVGGQAIGIGTTMLMHCDLVVATSSAKFQLPFVNLGLCPEAASSYLFPQMAGSKLANQLFFLGEVFNASTAKEAGIVNYITEEIDLFNKVKDLATKISEQPSEALISTKRLLKAHTSEKIQSVMDSELIEFSRLLVSPACKEIFTAFLEKRPPNKEIVLGS